MDHYSQSDRNTEQRGMIPPAEIPAEITPEPDYYAMTADDLGRALEAAGQNEVRQEGALTVFPQERRPDDAPKFAYWAKRMSDPSKLKRVYVGDRAQAYFDRLLNPDLRHKEGLFLTPDGRLSSNRSDPDDVYRGPYKS